VIVALERPTREQNALAPVLSAKDVGPAQRKLRTEPGWLYGIDGRASEAMLRLLLSLRGLRSAHSSISVAAFDAFVGPYRREAPGERDEAIGRFLLKLGRSHPDGLVLVLTGNLHAMKEPMRGYELDAMYIPANERISLEVTDTGTGESWTESDGGCGPSKSGVGAKGQTSQRGIYLDPVNAG
jgi:hypothetical protein